MHVSSSIESSKPQAPPASSSTETKEVTFNLTIVEGDTQKPITNLRYYLIYKGKPKEHRTDNQGIESNITAEVGQDIEICVAGDKKLQPVAHFKVSGSHEGKTIKVLLPVEAFNIEIKDHNKKSVKNRKFIIFYRGREIAKQTNSQGLIGVKMLVGFVYKFGLTAGKPLATLRCIKGAQTQTININEAAKNKAQGVSRPTTTTTKNPSSPPKPENNPPPTKPTATKPKPKPVTEESHTATNGRPITTVITDKAASDTTRYHIYYNGKIKRQNGNATGYAEFIYYDENGGKHNLGKSAYIPVSRLKAGNVVIDGDVYLVNQQKHESYKNGNIGYRWKIESDSKRYYLNGITLAATLGAMMSYGYEKYVGTGWSNVKGQSVAPSKTHRNGEAGDFRYLGKKGEHVTVPVHTTYSSFDMDANTRLVKHFKRFKFQAFYTGTKASGGVAKIPGTSWAPNHHHHLHVGGHSYEVEDI